VKAAEGRCRGKAVAQSGELIFYSRLGRIAAGAERLHVISRKALREFARKHTQAAQPLEEWYRTAKRAKWRNLSEVRASFPHADLVGTCTVFNIKGNSYRLIARIGYRKQRVYIRRVLTHAEYDKGGWKSECSD